MILNIASLDKYIHIPDFIKTYCQPINVCYVLSASNPTDIHRKNWVPYNMVAVMLITAVFNLHFVTNVLQQKPGY
jgi:hypothetical protein